MSDSRFGVFARRDFHDEWGRRWTAYILDPAAAPPAAAEGAAATVDTRCLVFESEAGETRRLRYPEYQADLHELAEGTLRSLLQAAAH